MRSGNFLLIICLSLFIAVFVFLVLAEGLNLYKVSLKFKVAVVSVKIQRFTSSEINNQVHQYTCLHQPFPSPLPTAFTANLPP